MAPEMKIPSLESSASRAGAWLIVVFLLAGIGCAFARDEASDKRDLLRIDAAVCHAFEVGDAAYLRKVLDARFTLTSSTGVVTDLAQNLQEVTTRESAYDMFRNHDQVCACTATPRSSMASRA
jgi:hypothetical protein